MKANARFGLGYNPSTFQGIRWTAHARRTARQDKWIKLMPAVMV
jgi:hypothetical protein